MSEGIFQHKTATLTMQPIRVNIERGDIPTQDCNTYYAAHKGQHERGDIPTQDCNTYYAAHKGQH